MNFIDRISITLSDSLDFVIDKNRQRAQLNRIDAIIKNETEILNRAYIALGKHYSRMLDGKEEEPDVSQICDTIRSAKLRLKKAKTRYEYIKRYGVPTPGRRDDLSVAFLDEDEPKCSQPSSRPCTESKTAAEEEQDITIAYADPQAKTDSVEEKIENAAETLTEKTDSVEEKIENAAETLKPEE